MLTRPRILLHVEGALILALSVYAYHRMQGRWLVFALLLLVPDVSMLGYLANVRIGAACYNFVHTLSLPLVLMVAAHLGNYPAYLAGLVIWTAHIGMDRMMGYGLKYPTQFKDTHLQHV